MKYLIPFLIPLLILPILSFLSRGAGPGRDDFFYRINIPWKTLPVLFKDGGDNTLINNPWEYLVTQINGLAVYLRLAFFPVRQNFYYDLPAQKSIFRSGITLSAIICSGLIITGARLLKKNRMEGWGILWFFCGLLPTSSILILWPFLSEYHLYLSLAGFSFFWAGFLIKSKPRGYRRGAGYFLLVILFFFSILAWKRNLIYSSAVLLWGDTARKSPELAPAHSNLSAACIGQGYFDLAVAASRRALELNPEFDGYQNLWAAYRHLGDSEKAEETARKHIERFPKKYEGYYELALVLLDNDDFARAGRTLEKILELNPDSTRIWNDLGRFYQRLRQPEKAREAFLQALEKNRRSVPAHFNLALVYWKDIRDYPQARHHLQEALKFNYNPALEKKIEKALFELDKQK